MKPGISRATAEMLIARWQKHIAREKPDSIRQRAFSRCIKELQEAMQSDESVARDAVQKRVVEGVRRAQAAGKHCGRPKLALDIQPALDLLKKGWSLNAIAKALNIKRPTLRRRLQDCGAWPID